MPPLPARAAASQSRRHHHPGPARPAPRKTITPRLPVKAAVSQSRRHPRPGPARPALLKMITPPLPARAAAWRGPTPLHRHRRTQSMKRLCSLRQALQLVAAAPRAPPPPRTGRAQLHRSPCLALAPPLPPLPHARALQSAEPPRCPLRCPALRVRRHCHRARSSPVHGHRAARLLMRRLPSHTQWMWIMRCALLCAWRCTTAPLSLAWGRLARPPPRRLAAVQRMMAARSKAEAPAWHPRTPIFFLPH